MRRPLVLVYNCIGGVSKWGKSLKWGKASWFEVLVPCHSYWLVVGCWLLAGAGPGRGPGPRDILSPMKEQILWQEVCVGCVLARTGAAD